MGSVKRSVSIKLVDDIMIINEEIAIDIYEWRIRMKFLGFRDEDITKCIDMLRSSAK